MSDLKVCQPPLIDAQGNINVHGREGISIPVKRYTDKTRTTQVDISGNTYALEVEGLTAIPLVADPLDVKGLLLRIDDLADAGIVVSESTPLPFVVRDTTGQTPIVRWEGLFIVRGWEV